MPYGFFDVGLVNGAMGTLQAICYRTGGPPDLPIAVMVHSGTYSRPTFPDGTVPIIPLHRCWSSSGGQCSRLQLPFKLAMAVTIHNSQGLTLNKVVNDVAKKEFSQASRLWPALMFVSSTCAAKVCVCMLVWVWLDVCVGSCHILLSDSLKPCTS